MIPKFFMNWLKTEPAKMIRILAGKRKIAVLDCICEGGGEGSHDERNRSGFMADKCC